MVSLAALAFTLRCTPALATDPYPFDGQWQTTVSCAAVRDALGYSFRFISEVKNGSFRGIHGIDGQSGSLLITGTIAPDGTGKLYGQGQTGSKEFVPGRDTPRGTDYSYSIDAHFQGRSGTGTRVEGRPCSFEFLRQ
jgi:hypothetical protein